MLIFKMIPAPRPHPARPARPGGESDWPASADVFCNSPRSRRWCRRRVTACRDRNCRYYISDTMFWDDSASRDERRLGTYGSMVSCRALDVGRNEWMPRQNPKHLAQADRSALRTWHGTKPSQHIIPKRSTDSFGLDRPLMYLDIVISTEDCLEKGRC